MRTPCKFLGPEWKWEDEGSLRTCVRLLRNGKWYVGIARTGGAVVRFVEFSQHNREVTGYVYKDENASIEEIKDVVEMLFATGVYK